MSTAKHTPTLPRMSVDKLLPGVIRMEGCDSMTGLIVGVRAPEIVRRCNSHDALVAALERIRPRIEAAASYATRARDRAVWTTELKALDVALKAAKGEA
jgi:hypothetical protein